MVVEHRRRDKRDADWPWQVEAGGQISRLWQVLQQVFGPIGPHDLVRNADKITHNPGPLGDRKASLLVDPPRDKLGDPTVRVRIARRADIRPDAAGRAVAADHVKELVFRKMSQFVETDQRNLCALPGIDRGIKLQVCELDLAAARPAPLARY